MISLILLAIALHEAPLTADLPRLEKQLAKAKVSYPVPPAMPPSFIQKPPKGPSI